MTVGFILMLLIAYVIVALALICWAFSSEINRPTPEKNERIKYMTVRELLEEFWREQDGEIEKIEHEIFWEDIQKMLRTKFRASDATGNLSKERGFALMHLSPREPQRSMHRAVEAI